MRTSPFIVPVVIWMAACGGSNGSTSPTAVPTPSPSGVNRPPEIVAASITPATGGWHYLTTYAAHIEARDPDGDRLIYSWTDWRGQSVDGVFSNGGTDVSFTAQGFQTLQKNVGPLTITVTDPRGGSANATLQFEARYLRHQRFRGRIGNVDYVHLLLDQTNDALSGLFHDPRRDLLAPPAQSDPASPGRIDAQGNFTIHFNVPRLGRLTLVGQVSDGYRYQLTGTAHGAGFAGDAFTFFYDDGY